jgi:nucleotide-binding universal stress UspA family protein
VSLLDLNGSRLVRRRASLQTDKGRVPHAAEYRNADEYRGADLLVVGLPYRKRFGGEFAIGRTIPYILQNAPCAVWVVRDPIEEPT